MTLVEAPLRPVAVIVVLEKRQCDSRKIEIKIAARTSILIFSATYVQSRPVNGARRGCHVRTIGGYRAIGGHLPTGIPLSPVQEALTISTPKLRLGERWAVFHRGAKPQGESHDPGESRKLLAGVAAASVILACGFAYAQQGPRGKSSYMQVEIDEPFSAIFSRLSAQKPEVTREHMALLNERYDLSDRPAAGLRWIATSRCRKGFASSFHRERPGRLLPL